MEAKILCGWESERTLFSLSKPFMEYATGTLLFPTFSFWLPSIQRHQILYIAKLSQLIFYPRALPVVIGPSATCFRIDFLC